MSEFTKNKRSWMSETHTRTSIARVYNMDLDTLMKCLKPIMYKLRYREENRRVLTIREVSYIVDHLGDPDIED